MSLDRQDEVHRGEATQRPAVREVSDVSSLRALAHPVRIALIETLTLHGPMTATEVGQRIGESATTCSFHLRQLARYHFVEEAGGGKGRARPWRMTSIGMRSSAAHDDPEAVLASRVLGQLFRERQLTRYRTWLETEGSYPEAWRRSAWDVEFLLYVTPEELAALGEELTTLLMVRFGERLQDLSARPDGAAPVEMLAFTYPIDLPARPR
jgi:DNA-binding transcriptional ArsR family regulator